MNPKDALAPLLILATIGTVSADCMTFNPAMDTARTLLITIGFPIGVFMIAYMGVKWVVAEGPEDRENARRGIIYVVIGLIILRAGYSFVNYIMCP